MPIFSDKKKESEKPQSPHPFTASTISLTCEFSVVVSCVSATGRRGYRPSCKLRIAILYSRALYWKKQNGVKTGYQKKECHENATFFSGKIKKNKYKRGISTTLVVQHRENLSVVSYHVYLKLI